MKLTLQIKLLPTKEQERSLLNTFKSCNTACNEISKIAWENKVFNQYQLHHRTYHNIKDAYKLSAQVVVRCISKVANSYKLDKKAQRNFKPLGAITYDTRILSYKKDSISIWSINGRLKIPFICHNQKYFPYIQGESDLIYKRKKFYLFQTVEVPEEDIKDIEDFIGIDFGIINIATTSDGQNFSGKQVDEVREKTTLFKKILQRKGTKSAKRHLKKLSGKERRFKKNTNHTISKQIVQIAKDTQRGIAIENIKSFRVTVRKEQRERFGKWAFSELRSFIEYKGILAGIPVIAINPKNTSRTCSQCGFISKSNRKSQSNFSCLRCDFSLNADVNAAKNIALLGRVNGRIAVHADSVVTPVLGTASYIL